MSLEQPTGQTGGYFDSFTNALASYYNFRGAEAAADANGASQAAQANTVPVQTATQTANIMTGDNTQKLVLGGLFLLGVVFVAKKL